MSDGTGWDLAQLNIGRLRAPTDDPMIKGFMDALEPVNALADRSPGFVWRLQTEDGDATAIRPYEDEMVAVNMSTWTSLEALADFVYGAEHRAIMVQRRKWFERMTDAFMVLWWVPAGHRPTVAEAKERLATLQAHGPTPEAFSFKEPFPAPDAVDPAESDERWGCSV